MPIYDYHCADNGQTVEVSHRMGVRPKTWGELCAMTRADVGDTSEDARVERVMTAAPMRLGAATPQAAAGCCASACGCAPSFN